MNSPPRCSAAGTGSCQRGRGWQQWCGRSWQGLGPTGNPGSQRLVFLKPTPKGRETKEKETNVIRLTCSGSKPPLLLRQWTVRNVLRLPNLHSPWNSPRKMAAYIHTLATWSCTTGILLKTISFHPPTTLSESTWTAWVFNLQLWERPEVKTGNFIK